MGKSIITCNCQSLTKFFLNLFPKISHYFFMQKKNRKKELPIRLLYCFSYKIKAEPTLVSVGVKLKTDSAEN